MKRGAEDIFTGQGQRHDLDISSIRLIGDRILVQDLPVANQIGSIFLPETVDPGLGKNGLLRMGRVVAAGPGDKCIEWGGDEYGNVRRRLITERCQCCVDGTVGEMRSDGSCWDVPCSECGGTMRVAVTVPPQCKVGDLVVYDRRRSEEKILNGQRFQLSHSEQSVFAVIEE